MMEYRVVFRTSEGQKAKRMDEANPLAAVNRVLNEWSGVYQIDRIERIVETEAGETTQPSDFTASHVEQQITVNVTK